jgi:hypothetical protein
MYAPKQVGGHFDVERAIAATGEKVDTRIFHGLPFSPVCTVIPAQVGTQHLPSALSLASRHRRTRGPAFACRIPGTCLLLALGPGLRRDDEPLAGCRGLILHIHRHPCERRDPALCSDEKTLHRYAGTLSASGKTLRAAGKSLKAGREPAVLR